jgi:hypothetical protein
MEDVPYRSWSDGMARKRKEPKMPQAAAPIIKPVRLDLSPSEHHLLRRRAADANMSMAKFARLVIVRALRELKEPKEGP